MSDEKEGQIDEKTQEQLEVEAQKQSPLLLVSEYRHLFSIDDSSILPTAEKTAAGQKLFELIKARNMAPYYLQVCQQFKQQPDAKMLETMKAANEKELKSLEEKIVDAEKNLGDSEVREAKLNKANYLALIGDKDAALKVYDETMEKTVGGGSRIDLVFSLIRLALCHDDSHLLRKAVNVAKSLVEKGGDWERRNLLHVYEAVYSIKHRQLKEAAKLLLDSVATFTCYPLMSYTSFIFYTVLCAVVSLDRVSLRDKVIKSPDVLSVINDIPHLKDLVFSLYKCQYAQFFSSLSAITPFIKRDRYLGPHTNFFLREVRIVAYQQFLESYRSVQLQAMASSFGVSVAFLDRELSRFINAGRLSAKIDKVAGIVETSRPEIKNNQYLEVIKQGDSLLSRIQKLSKVVTM